MPGDDAVDVARGCVEVASFTVSDLFRFCCFFLVGGGAPSL